MQSTPISSFRVPDGKLALTIDLHDCSLFSIVLDVDKIQTVLASVESAFNLSSSDRRNISRHAKLRHSAQSVLRNLKPGQDDVAMQGAGIGVLWCALNHPSHGEQMRRAISQALRQRGKAHITVSSDDKQAWSFAVSEQYVDQTNLLDALPPDLDEPVAFEYISASEDVLN